MPRSHAGDGDVVSTRVLAREFVDETIEVGIAGVELRAIVTLAERPDLDHAPGRGAHRSVCRSPSA